MTRLIDAEKFEVVSYVGTEGREDTFDDGVLWMLEKIDAAPTIKIPAIAKRGHWIYGNQFHWFTASCSECGYMRTTDINLKGWNSWNYCPMCGARMDAERKEDGER